MFELDSFIYHLKNDTQASRLTWNSIQDSWADEYCSFDFRNLNTSLNSWINKSPFIYNNWNDIYVTHVFTGFIYVAKQIYIPPLYSLYLQPDAHSKIYRLNYDSMVLKELYDLIQQQSNVSNDDVMEFIYTFNISHAVDTDDNE